VTYTLPELNGLLLQIELVLSSSKFCLLFVYLLFVYSAGPTRSQYHPNGNLREELLSWYVAAVIIK